MFKKHNKYFVISISKHLLCGFMVTENIINKEQKVDKFCVAKSVMICL